jgi:ribosomal protein S18 acetylase RimI-like enzyme
LEELRLERMTAAEFGAYRAWVIPQRAEVKVGAGDWAADEALELASREVDKLLPAGVDTPGMLLLTARTSDGETLGMLWIGFDRPDQRDTAWIYYIEVQPQHRGKGYGRELLRRAEGLAARRGAQAMALNSFGSNTVARNLYESSGYEVMSVVMRKTL